MSFIGIDVAKAQLEFACRPGGETGGVPNEERGITQLVVRCRTLAPTLIVCEATGGYEAALVAALATAGLPVVVANPARCASSPKPPASSRRPTRSTLRSSPSLPSECGPSPARCPTRP